MWKFTFSSSVIVYGNPYMWFINKGVQLRTTNIHGATKLMIEDMLRNIARANYKLNIDILRYFNPVGAYSSSLIDEDANGIINNLMPYIIIIRK